MRGPQLLLATSFHRHWFSILVLAAFGASAVLSFALVSHFRARTRRVAVAAGANQQVVVTGQSETDPKIMTLVEDLRKRGFSTSQSSAAVPLLTATGTRSVVFTPSGFHATPADLISSIAKSLSQ
jgi:hypothetical protein